MSNCTVNCTNISPPFSPVVSWILGFLSAVVSISTIIGNVLVIASFFFERALRTSTNYFIASLAVTDLLIGIFSMNFYTIYLLLSYWPLGELFCDLWLSLDYTACLTSQYTVFFITVDRFCSVKIPAKYRNWRTDCKVQSMVAITWIVPFAVFFTTIMGWPYLNHNGRTRESNQCYADFAREPIFNTILTIAYFWITLIVMIVLYAGIYKVALNLQAKSDNKKKRIIELIPSSSKIGTDASESGMKSSNMSQSLTNSLRQSSYHLGVIQLMDNTSSSNNFDSIRYYHLEKGMKPQKNADYFISSNDSSLNAGSDSEISKISYIFMNSNGQKIPTFIYSSQLSHIESPYIPVENETNNKLTNSTQKILPVKSSLNNYQTNSDNKQNRPFDTVIDNCHHSETSYSMHPLSGLGFISQEEFATFLTKTQEIKVDVESFSAFPYPATYSPVWIKRSLQHNQTNNITTTITAATDETVSKTESNKRSSSLIAPIRFVAQRFQKKSIKPAKKRERSVSRARKALRTITFILGAFVLSWTPFHIIVLIKGFCDNTKNQHTCINAHLYNLSYWLCYLNSPINPFCYALANVQFKRTFLRILRCDFRRS